MKDQSYESVKYFFEENLNESSKFYLLNTNKITFVLQQMLILI